MEAERRRGRGERVPPPVREAARLLSGRPAWGMGVRAALATLPPLLAGPVLGDPSLLWMGLAGLITTLADKGGMYRSRALAMLAAATGGAAGVALGSLTGPYTAAAVAAMLAWGALSGMARVYGATAGAVGTLTAVLFVISLGSPEDTDPARRAALTLAGGGWAMALGLFLWPFRPYHPARLAVARCYDALARFAARLADQSTDDGTGPEDPTLLFGEVRQALEQGRAHLASVRRGRPGESPRGERLRVLLESADQMLGALVGLADVLESLSLGPALAAHRRAVGEALRAFEATARRLADAIPVERGEVELDRPAWPQASAGDAADRAPGILRLRHAALLLRVLRDYADAAVEAAAGLNSGRAPRPAAGEPTREPPPSLWEPLRAHLSGTSLLLRHALRVAVVAALAVWLTAALEIQRGYWVTLTVLIVLQPYTGATLVRGLQRGVGTVLGGVLAAAIAALVHDPLGLALVVTVLAVTSVSLLPLNYGLYSVFLTPTFVLLAEVNAGDWSLAGLRIVNTLLGGAIALAGAWLLWSEPERERLPSHLAAALAALQRYLAGVLDVLAGQAGAPSPLAALRRAVGLEILNADASLQRLVTEPGGRGEALESAMTLLTYLRRLTGALAALSAAPPAEPGARASLRSFGEDAAAVLADLERSIREGAPPAPLPDLAPPPELQSPLVRAQLERVARVLRVLHAAAARGAHPETPAVPGS